MSADPRRLPESDAWDGSWEAHEDRQRRSRMRATPAQRLAWLEQAIAFAHSAGALPPPEPQPGGGAASEGAGGLA